ncbi:MAG TPA: DUF885 domain-containing protein [Micromonosporaceae bacterium]
MAHQELATLADEYFHARLAAEPFLATMFGVAGYDSAVPDRSRAADQRLIATLSGLERRLTGISPEGLTGPDLVTRAMLATGIRDHRESLEHGLREVSVSGGVMGVLSEVLASVPAVSLRDQAAADAYLARLAALEGFFDRQLTRHREAAADGRTPTALGVRQAVDQLDDYLSRDDDPLLRPAPPGDGQVGRGRVAHVLTERVHPALRRFRESLAEELLPTGRDDDHVGVCHVPGGREGYLTAVRAHTTTGLSPDEIHQIGLATLAELRTEFADLGGRVLGERDVPTVLHRLREDRALRFDSAGQIVEVVTTALRRAEEALPDWFRTYPTAPCVVREMHPSEAKGGVLGYYLPPSGNGSRPGTHVINTYRPEIRPRYEYQALAFHESVPGHHTQLAVAQTLTGLPDFRRFGFVTAHSEGWALYAERLANEMGLYSDEVSRLGMVSFDAWRACRLVVDTGMHHLGWSRPRAIEFMRDNTALSEANIANEVDRYIAEPGQALAYLIGRIRIRELRSAAQATLRSRFDIREFHHQVLGHGALPLDTLEEVVAGWVRDNGSP